MATNNPFPGPQPYQREDRDRFFGRDEATEELTDCIRAYRVLTVYGLSGAGKSSLLQAGAIPSLMQSTDWRVVVVDSWPPERLFKAGPSSRLIEALNHQLELGLPAAPDVTDAVARAMRRSSRPLLIVLDQLEQLLEYHSVEDILELVRSLEALNAIRDAKLHIVLSLREDYLGRWTDLLRSHPNLTRNTFRLARLTTQEMVSSVVLAAGQGEPAQDWDADKIRPLIQEMEVPGQLRSDQAEVEAAYVQIVCRALWEQGGLEAAAHQTSKGIMTGYLDTTLSSLGPLAAQAQVLLEDRLITLSGTRTFVTRAGALEVVPNERDLDRILETLAGARILRAQQHQGGVFFELGHDWLVKKVQESAEQRREAERQRREAERLRLEKEENARKRRERIRRNTIILIICVVVLGIAGAFYRNQESLADSVAAKAEAEKAAAIAKRTAITEATLRKEAENQETKAKAERTRAEVERARAVTAEGEAQTQASLAEASRVLAEAARLEARKQADKATSSEARARAEASHAHDALLMAASQALRESDPTLAAVFLGEIKDVDSIPGWAEATNEVIRGPISRAILQDPARLWLQAVFSPDGTLVATAGDDSTVWLLPATGKGKARKVLSLVSHIYSMTFSPDGVWLAVGDQHGAVRLVSVRDPGEPVLLQGPPGPVYAMSFSHDGRLAAASEDGTARIWPANGRGPAIVLKGHVAAVTDVAFSSSGDQVVTASRDATARVWAANGQGAPMVLKGHSAQLTSAAFNRTGQWVLTTSQDGTARLWPVNGPGEARVLQPARSRVSAAIFSPDGARVLTGDRDGDTTVWPLTEPGVGTVVGEYHGGIAVTSIASSPDGERILAGGLDGMARLDFSWGYIALKGHQGSILSVAFSADGRNVLTLSRDGTARIWPDPVARWKGMADPEGQKATSAPELSKQLYQLTTACVLPKERVHYLTETKEAAETAYRACEDRYGR